jgi:hypothetical protein
MGTTYAIGSDGDVTLPSGYNAELQTWSCSITRTTQVVTGFGDTGTKRKQSAIVDLTGSAGGVPTYNDSSTAPFPLSGTTMNDVAGGSISLFINNSSPDSLDCKIVFGAVFSSYDLSSDQDGASSITFNFQLADDNGPIFTWSEV